MAGGNGLISMGNAISAESHVGENAVSVQQEDKRADASWFVNTILAFSKSYMDVQTCKTHGHTRLPMRLIRCTLQVGRDFMSSMLSKA